MRIIAGSLGGRTFEAPHTSKTHPMSERMRGALFNTLGDITGLTVLDAFGGSGALSFEAISRGAESSLITDVDKTAHQTIVRNIKKLGVEKKIKAIRINISKWSSGNSNVQFDLVLANPPFDTLKLELIQRLVRHVKKGGLLVLSWPTRTSTPELPGSNLVGVKEKNYGDAQLVFYRKIS
jgi:16S rRNA (guanine966-N2)-methyltransferase